jgi:hypothetical protein
MTTLQELSQEWVGIDEMTTALAERIAVIEQYLADSPGHEAARVRLANTRDQLREIRERLIRTADLLSGGLT